MGPNDRQPPAGSLYYLRERRSKQCDFFRFLQLSVSTGRRGNEDVYSVSVGTVEDHGVVGRSGREDTDEDGNEGWPNEVLRAAPRSSDCKETQATGRERFPLAHRSFVRQYRWSFVAAGDTSKA